MFAEFYENSEIFITGGSGVVGKAAIEKLLRSSNVKKIYILMRSKKGVTAEKRLEEMKRTSKIFNVLKQNKPNELDKLVAVPGNIGLDGLGISPEYREMIKNVSVFFNSAATTRFIEPIRTAIRLNVKSTLESLKLAETFKNLRIFVHVSTYFSNPGLRFIEDKVYPAVFDWRTAMKMLDNDTMDAELDILTDKILDNFPNTYIFTKHLSEQVVNEYRFKLPVAIFRPSIVITGFDEPEPGFTETITGIMGMMTVWGTGIIQAFYLKAPDVNIDLTPLDFGTKVLLMFAVLKSQLPKEKFIEATPVGKFSSNIVLKMTLREQCNALTEAVYKYPLEKAFWIPNMTVTSCRFQYWIVVIFNQILPSLLIDFGLKLCRRKPFMMQIQRKAFSTSEAVQFFITNQFRSEGITDFEELLRLGKGTEFAVNSLLEHFKNKASVQVLMDRIASGCRKFMFDEPDSSIEICKKILMAKRIAYSILKGYIAYIIIRAIIPTIMAYVDKQIY